MPVRAAAWGALDTVLGARHPAHKPHVVPAPPPPQEAPRTTVRPGDAKQTGGGLGWQNGGGGAGGWAGTDGDE